MDNTDEFARELYTYWARSNDLLNAPEAEFCPACGAEQPKKNIVQSWRNLNTNQQLIWTSLAIFIKEQRTHPNGSV